MKTALYLDDQRTPTTTLNGYSNWVVVRNFDQFKEYIENNGVPDLISFDHDLADEHMEDYIQQVGINGYQHPDYDSYTEKTGLDCARWLVEYIQANNLQLGYVCVHSHNPVGASNIQSLINGFKRHMGWPEDCWLGRFPFTLEKTAL